MIFEGEYGFLQLDKVCAVKITGQRTDYISNIAPQKFTQRAWKDDILVTSFPRRMLLKIERSPRAELYKSVIPKGCDHTFV